MVATRDTATGAGRRMRFVTPDDERRISAAIVAVEKTTSGEIVAVIAAESDSYSFVPYLWAALAALLVPLPLIFLTWWPIQWIYLLQLLVFGLGVALLWSRSVRALLVPANIKRDRAHARAVEQFLVQNLHTTDGRTGVLIFVSIAERYAEILADNGIHKKVPQATWDAIVAQLTTEIGAGRTADAFVHAVETLGVHLAKHFPPGSHDPNQLPNHLIVLE
jgi:putative membrane protein